MKRMRRILALLVMAALLAGCGVLPENALKEEDRRQLISLLDRIAESLHPGTAGSSLVSAGVTSELIDWAAATKLSAQETAEAVRQWLESQSEEIREAFAQQLESIGGTYAEILRDGAKGLLESAGVQQELPEMDMDLKSILNSILASGGLESGSVG